MPPIDQSELLKLIDVVVWSHGAECICGGWGQCDRLAKPGTWPLFCIVSLSVAYFLFKFLIVANVCVFL